MKTDGSKSTDLTLVIGAGGKTGRRVVERLSARGVPVRAVSRSTNPRFDWEDRSTWPGALEQVWAVYITYQPDLAVPGAVETIRALTELAVRRGVRRLVLLSGRGEAEAQACERIVQDAGVEWTILRASWFFQNFSEGAFRDAVLAGEIALPAGGVREPFIDANDIADVAVRALTSDDHVGRLYELTGPRLLTFSEAVGEIAAAAGREVRYVQLSRAAFAETLAAAGLPGDAVWLMDYLFSTVLDGRNACLGNGVQQALGREPADFADYARETAATGAWGSAEAHV